MENDVFYGKETEPIEGLTEQNIITEEDVKRGIEILTQYKDAKSTFEKKLIENEEWWKLNHWKYLDPENEHDGPKPSSAWLFNTVMNKHADAMDNFPEPIVLPRELSDEGSADVLTSILPVVLENGGFFDAYNMQWWEKLKNGTGTYGSFWNSELENGLGDVSVNGLDLLNVFWQPGINDIQKSRNLFITALCDNDLIEEQFPSARGKAKGNVIEIGKYVHDKSIDTTDKSVVVDWYYRKRVGGKVLLHYIKFVGNTLLYASENDERYRDTGWYIDGEYPVVFDVLFPEKDMPCGFGFVDICRNPQEYVDRLASNVLESSMIGSKTRYLASSSTNINIEEFKDINKPIVTVEGDLSDARVKQIVTQPPSSIYLDVWQMKIEEMKDTASNRDVNSGGSAGGGVTAAAAIAALQEAGNKNSRDMLNSTYRAMEKLFKKCIERMRQYYTEKRTVRIVGNTERGYEFKDFDASRIRDIQTGIDTEGNPTFRHPVFDLKVKAQKKNPFSRMEQNERAKELYALGFFSPDRAEESLCALDMMEFEGIDKVREKVKTGQTLMNIVKAQEEELNKLRAMLGIVANPMQNVSGGGAPISSGGNAATDGIMQANTPMTSYGQSLAERSIPSAG